MVESPYDVNVFFNIPMINFSYHTYYISIQFRDFLLLVFNLYCKKIYTRVRLYLYIQSDFEQFDN